MMIVNNNIQNVNASHHDLALTPPLTSLHTQPQALLIIVDDVNDMSCGSLGLVRQ